MRAPASPPAPNRIFKRSLAYDAKTCPSIRCVPAHEQYPDQRRSRCGMCGRTFSLKAWNRSTRRWS